MNDDQQMRLGQVNDEARRQFVARFGTAAWESVHEDTRQMWRNYVQRTMFHEGAERGGSSDV